MSQFLPEGSQSTAQTGTSEITPGNPTTTQEDIKLMQRVFSAAVANPNLVPADWMAYTIDFIQTSNLQIPIGQVFGYQRIAPQVITDFAQVPSPVDGQIVLVKVGSGSPFIYVQFMYDQALGQWVSEEFPAGGAAATSTSGTAQNVGGMTGLSWAPVNSLGLTFQVKWAGTLENEGGGTGDAQLLLVWSTPGSTFTTATMLHSSVSGDAVTHPVGSDWTTVSNPGAYNMVAIGFQAWRAAGSVGTTVLQAGAVGRFIK